MLFTGDWNLVIGSRNNEERANLSILSNVGNEVEGVMTSKKLDNADLPLNKQVSLCNGSNLHMVARSESNEKKKRLTYIFDCKVAADGNSFEGLIRWLF